MPDYVKITTSAAERIAAAVKRIENQGGAPAPYYNNYRGTSEGFWAEITGGDQQKRIYSWTMLETQSNKLAPNDNWGSGSIWDDRGFAVEAKYYSPFVFPGERVRMWPSRNQEYMLFDYWPDMKWGQVMGKIGKRRGTSPGTGYVEVYQFVVGGGWQDLGRIQVGNHFGQEINSRTSPVVQISYHSGLWWVSAADCVSSAGGSSLWSGDFQPQAVPLSDIDTTTTPGRHGA